MNKEQFAVFAAALRTFYPREQLLPNDKAMELWYQQLKDIPYEIAEITLQRWVSTNRWSPSIADIREHAAMIRCGEKPLWSDGWEEVLKAIRYFGSYRETEALQSMSPITRQVVKRLGFRNLCMAEDIMADRANFRMIYEQIADREQTAKQLSPGLTQLIESARISQNLLETKE